jgi:type IV pilus assembly protein PilN
MIRINLLNLREDRKKENRRQDISVSILMGVLTILIGGHLYINVSREAEILQKQLTLKKAEDVKLTKKVGEIKNLEKKNKELKKKIRIVETLNRNRLNTLKVMEEVSIQIPQKIWFKSLQKRGNVVTINGVSLDDQTLSVFISRLNHSEKFKNVWLQQSKQILSNKVKLKGFSLYCNVVKE